jgi:hypothetical protein
MKILFGCESSGTMRRAFRALGHDAWSCDILPADDGSIHHIQGDVLERLEDGWDMAVFHPPCTHLAVSGARHFAAKRADGRQQAALEFALKLWNAPIPKIALEQPVSVLASVLGKAHQVVHPYWFGHMEQKATCFWLKNLPLLVPTDDVKAEMLLLPKNVRERIHYMPPGPDRWKLRSKTFDGLAKACAMQWGGVVPVMRDLFEEVAA